MDAENIKSVLNGLDEISFMPCQEMVREDNDVLIRKTASDALDVIRELKAENEQLNKDVSDLKKDGNRWYSKNTQLEKEINRLKTEKPKKQQPIVLTKTEIADFIDDIVWYETKDQDNRSDYFAIVDGYSFKHEAVWLRLISCDRNNRLSTADYGINWRVWSARPTDEQRKAEPWEEGKQDGI